MDIAITICFLIVDRWERRTGRAAGRVGARSHHSIVQKIVISPCIYYYMAISWKNIKIYICLSNLENTSTSCVLVERKQTTFEFDHFGTRMRHQMELKCASKSTPKKTEAFQKGGLRRGVGGGGSGGGGGGGGAGGLGGGIGGGGE